MSKITLDEAYQQGRADAIKEIQQSVHDIYAEDLYCLADMCEEETKGYNCEDCLFVSINQSINHIKEQK